MNLSDFFFFLIPLIRNFSLICSTREWPIFRYKNFDRKIKVKRNIMKLKIKGTLYVDAYNCCVRIFGKFASKWKVS